MGTPFDCKPCPCPNRGACQLIGDDDTIVCLECPTGYMGKANIHISIYKNITYLMTIVFDV